MIKKLFGDLTFKWWEVSLLKSTMFSVGIVLGVEWSSVLREWIGWFIIIFGIGIVYFMPKVWERLR
jgi:hypothetical protein